MKLSLNLNALHRIMAVAVVSVGLCGVTAGNSFGVIVGNQTSQALTLLLPGEMTCTGLSASETDSGLAGTYGFSNPAWVSYLYGQILGRAPDAAGYQVWLNAANSGVPRVTIVDGFLKSPEYCSKTVTSMYNILLKRQPDPKGFAALTAACEAGENAPSIMYGICQSPEYNTFLVPYQAKNATKNTLHMFLQVNSYQGGQSEAIALPPNSTTNGSIRINALLTSGGYDVDIPYGNPFATPVCSGHISHAVTSKTGFTFSIGTSSSTPTGLNCLMGIFN